MHVPSPHAPASLLPAAPFSIHLAHGGQEDAGDQPQDDRLRPPGTY